MQDEIVREVLWQATCTAMTEDMEVSIREEIDLVSDMLSSLYSRGEKDIVERNEKVARMASMQDVSKWNQQLIAGHKNSKRMRSEISKELAIVDALLKRNRTQRDARKAKRRSRNSARSFVRGQSPGEEFSSALGFISPFSALFFSIGACALSLESFENIASQENGPGHLAQIGAVSVILILMFAQLHALRSLHRRAAEDVERLSSTSLTTSDRKSRHH